MDKIDEVKSSVEGKYVSFMAGKPMWAFWVLYTVISGVLFGVLYGIVRLISLRWWIIPIVIIGAGLAWGTTRYSVMKSRQEPEKAA